LTDWLATCRAAVEDVRGVLVDLPTRVEREPVVGAGEGGDDTVAIDAASEDAIVRRLEATGASFTLISEELGERVFGEGGSTHIVVDPIDGSLNAKRGIPFFALSLAVADGPTMGDVHFGYVYDFGTGEEWTAHREAGAFLGEQRLGDVRPKDEIEILSFEATLTSSVAEKAAQMVGIASQRVGDAGDVKPDSGEAGGTDGGAGPAICGNGSTRANARRTVRGGAIVFRRWRISDCCTSARSFV